MEDEETSRPLITKGSPVCWNLPLLTPSVQYKKEQEQSWLPAREISSAHTQILRRIPESVDIYISDEEDALGIEDVTKPLEDENQLQLNMNTEREDELERQVTRLEQELKSEKTARRDEVEAAHSKEEILLVQLTKMEKEVSAERESMNQLVQNITQLRKEKVVVEERARQERGRFGDIMQTLTIDKIDQSENIRKVVVMCENELLKTGKFFDEERIRVIEKMTALEEKMLCLTEKVSLMNESRGFSENVSEETTKANQIKDSNYNYVQQDDVKQDDVKQDDVQQDDVKQDDVKQDDFKQNDVQQDDVKQNDVKHNDVKQDDDSQKVTVKLTQQLLTLQQLSNSANSKQDQLMMEVLSGRKEQQDQGSLVQDLVARLATLETQVAGLGGGRKDSVKGERRQSTGTVSVMSRVWCWVLGKAWGY